MGLKLNVIELIVSRECVAAHGKQGAVDIAVEMLEKAALHILNSWGDEVDIKLEFKLTLDRPDPNNPE